MTRRQARAWWAWLALAVLVAVVQGVLLAAAFLMATAGEVAP